MNDFLVVAALMILLSMAVALVRVLYGPSHIDRLMAAQLLGTSGVSSVLLLGVVNQQAAMLDIALVLALLAAFTGIAFVYVHQHRLPGEAPKDDKP